MKFSRTHDSAFDIDAMFDRLINREDLMLLADYDRTIREALKIFEPARLHLDFLSGCLTSRRPTGFAGLRELPPVPVISAGVQMLLLPATCRRKDAAKLFKPMDGSIRRLQSDFRAISLRTGSQT